MEVTIQSIEPTYRKENGVWVLNLSDLKIPFQASERAVVSIPSGEIAGNHKHPRKESFVGLGELIFHWVDKEGNHKSEHMNKDGRLFLITVESGVPHAVQNTAKDLPGYLYEHADGPQRDVERVIVV
jgi:quercetin dioxygenase-like cupin family protein